MSTLEVDDDALRLRLGFWERVAALRGDVTVPRSAVRAVSVVDDLFGAVRGVRAPGLAIPRVRLLGTWWRRPGRDFVDVRRGQRGVVVELVGLKLRRLVVSVDDPEAIAAALA